MWQSVVQISKSTLDVKSAVEKAGAIISSVEYVTEALSKEEVPSEELMEKFSSLSQALDCSKLLAGSELDDSQQKVKSQLDEAIKSLACDPGELEDAEKDLADFLKVQFLAQCDGDPNSLERLALSVQEQSRLFCEIGRAWYTGLASGFMSR